MHKISACFGLYHRRCRHSKLIVSGAGSINGRVPVRQSVCLSVPSINGGFAAERRVAGAVLQERMRAVFRRQPSLNTDLFSKLK